MQAGHQSDQRRDSRPFGESGDDAGERHGDDQDVSPLTLAQGFNNLSHRQASQELRLNGSAFDHLLDYTVGGFYFDQTTIYRARQDLRYVAFPLGLDFLHNDPVEADAKAGFVHGVLNLADKFYFVNEFDLSNLVGSVAGLPAPPRTWSVSVRRNFR